MMSVLLQLGGYTIGAKPDRETPGYLCYILHHRDCVLFSVLLDKTYLQPIKISEIFSGIFALCRIAPQR